MNVYTVLLQCILEITLPVLIQYIILVLANQVKETYMLFDAMQLSMD